ncbi:YdcF family protein [Gemella sp. GH3]|uniref:YdcF family protein n=1 Tax=unclassified Gemella TaxID=2624949 RepID=UPI0015D01C1C|nr:MULTISPECIES: YdcF family protein [unclassified Gemella]MBF0714296.1 YdcF family protein [Gemella sp. GH3.1]NYS51248.1 YdcF family protein [Gemella sp. GH3]
MFIYIITFIIFIILVISMYRDLRSLLNPILLIIFLFLFYISLLQISFDSDYGFIYNILLILGFVGIPITILIMGIFLIYNGVIILRKEGYSKTNILSLFLGISILFFYFSIFVQLSSVYNSVNPYFAVLSFFIFYTFLLFVFSFVGYLLYSILYNLIPKNKSYDFIIIHGAGLINGEIVTPLLKKRIDKAIYAFHKSKNKNVKIIASGGKGIDEKISEAQAIFNYIESRGDVPLDKIILEDTSRTTYENLVNSKKLGEQEVNNPKFLFVTNDYHVFRTSTYAKRIKMRGDGLGCRTAGYYIPSAFIREYVAIIFKLKWLFVFLYLIFFAVIFLSYIPYNF